MKSILLLAISAFVIIFSFGQDWSIINPNRTVFFQHSDSAYITNTIVVDSTDILGMDSTFYTGYAFKYCDTCQGFSLAQPIIYRYAKELLGFSITHSSSHQNYILDEDTIYHHAQLSDSWDFNASQTASVVAVGETSILGVTDSIKTIELSTNDTIILSKNYGVIRYPDFENTGAYFDMVGYHQGQNSFGDYLPNFWRTYDFNVGDVFCYRNRLDDSGIFEFREENVRIKILNKTITNTQIEYEIQYLSVLTIQHGLLGPGVFYTYDYSNEIRNVVLTNCIGSYENSFGIRKSITDQSCFNSSPFFAPIFSGYSSNESYISAVNSKYMSNYLYLYQQGIVPNENSKVLMNFEILSDSLLIGANNFNYIVAWAILYNNYGATFDFIEDFEFYTDNTLVGTIINGDTSGTIFNYPDDLGLKNDESSKVLNVYPNPTHDNIYIPQSFKTISVFTTLGQKVLEVNTGDTILDVSALQKGIYLIQAVDQNGMVYQSKILKN
ncbi:MAG: T9SS type A sorting domain-containing protein [Putridiphycobacter sp.]